MSLFSKNKKNSKDRADDIKSSNKKIPVPNEEEVKKLKHEIKGIKVQKGFSSIQKEFFKDEMNLRKVDTKIDDDTDSIKSMSMKIDNILKENQYLKHQIGQLKGKYSHAEIEIEKFKTLFKDTILKKDIDKLKEEIKGISTPLKMRMEDLEYSIRELKNLKNEVIPLIDKSKIIEQKHKEDYKDFERYKKIIINKLDDKIEYYEKIIKKIQKETDLLFHQNHDEIRVLRQTVDKEVEKFKGPINHLLKMSEEDVKYTLEIEGKMKAYKQENAEMKVTVARMVSLVQKLLSKNK